MESYGPQTILISSNTSIRSPKITNILPWDQEWVRVNMRTHSTSMTSIANGREASEAADTFVGLNVAH